MGEYAHSAHCHREGHLTITRAFLDVLKLYFTYIILNVIQDIALDLTSEDVFLLIIISILMSTFQGMV